MACIYLLQFAHVPVPMLSFGGDGVDVGAVVVHGEDQHRLVLVVDAALLLLRLEELLLLKLLRQHGCSGSWEGVVVVELYDQPAFPLLRPSEQVRVDPRWQPDLEQP